MIIIEPALKDTFVTDMFPKINNGAKSNFGQASVLDLFKIASKNKKIKARGLITIANANNIVSTDTIEIIDYLGNVLVFNFGANVAEQINIDKDAADLVAEIVSVINGETSNITAHKVENNKVLLEQVSAGLSGETSISLNLTSAGCITKKDFLVFEHSAVLLKFDIKNLLESHIATKSNSIFNDNTNYKAYIKLKDVGFSTTHAKNYKLRLRVLNNDFEEGLGNDIIHFSDLGDANFETLDENNNIQWAKSGFVSESDTYTFNDGGTIHYFTSSTNTIQGDEDIVFDITDYIQHFFDSSGEISSVGLPQTFVIDFDHDYTFDSNTYFLKRLGSRNLKNKNNQPKLKIEVKDNTFNNVDFTNRQRFIGEKETFYIANLVNKNLSAFNADYDVKARISYMSDVVTSSELSLFKIPTNNLFKIRVVDSHANQVNITLENDHGNNLTIVPAQVNEYTIGIQDLDINGIIAKLKSDLEGVTGVEAEKLLKSLSYVNTNEKLTITNLDNGGENILSIISDAENTSVVVNNTSSRNILSVNQANPLLEKDLEDVYNYKGSPISGIKKLVINDTNELLVSRFINNDKYQKEIEDNQKVKINIYYFLKSKANTTEYKIKDDTVEFFLPQTFEDNQYEQIRVSLNSRQKKIQANDTIQDIEFSFIDVVKQYDAVNIPIDIVSLDLGNVSYEIFNVDTKEKILTKHSDLDCADVFFNGKFYVMRLFASSLFKNTRVFFKFQYTDALTGLKRQISDENIIVSFK